MIDLLAQPVSYDQPVYIPRRLQPASVACRSAIRAAQTHVAALTKEPGQLVRNTTQDVSEAYWRVQRAASSASNDTTARGSSLHEFRSADSEQYCSGLAPSNICLIGDSNTR